MVFVILLLIEIALFFEMLQRIRQLTCAHLVAIYCAVSQIVFYFADSIGAKDSLGPESRLTFIYNNDLGIITYFIIFVITYLSVFGLKSSHADLSNALVKVTLNSRNQIGKVVWTCFGLTIIHISMTDFSSLYFHSTYEVATTWVDSPEIIAALKFHAMIGILCCILLCVSILVGSKLNTFLMSLCVAWYFIYAFTGSSRHAVVLLFVFGGCAYSLFKAHRNAILLGFGLLIVFTLRAMLAGRGGSEFGIVAIPNFIEYAVDMDTYTFRDELINIFQGVFITTDGLTLTNSLNSVYATLSISPLPSFIDGFDTVLPTGEFRLSAFVPMSAITETYLFGLPVLPIVIFFYVFSIRSIILVSNRGYTLISQFNSLFFFAIFVQAQAYPLRNVFRQMLFLDLLNIIILLRIYFKQRSVAPNKLRQ